MATKKIEPGLLEKLRTAFDATGKLFTAIDAATLGGASLSTIWVTTSNTLRVVLILFTVVGGVVGYFILPSLFKGVAWKKRFYAFVASLLLTGAFLLLVVLVFVILNP